MTTPTSAACLLGFVLNLGEEVLACFDVAIVVDAGA